MPYIEVRVLFRAPPEAVFRAVSDHERLFSGPLIRSCRLTELGAPDRNGLGAMREIRGLGMHFVEEIVVFDAPRAYEYRVRQVNLPARHEMGRLDFRPCAEGTEVVWQTRYQIEAPRLLRSALEAASAFAFRTIFTALLARRRTAMQAEPN